MVGTSSIFETVVQELTAVGMKVEDLEGCLGETIRPPTPAMAARDFAATLSPAPLGRSAEKLIELRGILGEGGMGTVHLGHQLSLDRSVAVKSLRPSEADPRSVQRLLREARVTGSLDHPNVVPVYDIVSDPSGLPWIVLKRIEGEPWSNLIREEAAVRTRFGAADLLEWNASVVLALCDALSLAHSRGIAHRDLKPDNVMIGAFGEVYLVDWGIAVAIDPMASPMAPSAAEATMIAGTPHYMAPEMLGGRPSTARSDVYLLGAVTYEVLAGHPPHRGQSLQEILSQIVHSEPALPAHVSPELAEVVRKAMHRDPERRYASAAELKAALKGALRRRDSDRIALRGELLLEGLRRDLGEAGALDDAAQAQVQRRFIECRVVFRDALELDPDQGRARSGSEALCVAMVEHELARGDVHAARAILSELFAPPAELSARVEAAVRSKEDAAQRLETLRQAHDPKVGSRTRFAVAAIMAVIWVLMPFMVNTLILHGVFQLDGSWRNMVVPTGLLVVASGLCYWARESLMRTKINRALMVAVLSAMSLNFFGSLTALYHGYSVAQHIHSQFAVFAGIAAMGAVIADAGLWVVAAAYLLAYLVVPFFGDRYVLYGLSAANASFLWVAFFRFGRVAQMAHERTQPRDP